MAAEIALGLRLDFLEEKASMRPRRMAAEIRLATGQGAVCTNASMRPRRMAAEIVDVGRRLGPAAGLQ